MPTYASPSRLPMIAPSILSADFARLGEECRGVLDAGADALHLDVMDGHFVPNLTMGPDLCRGVRGACPRGAPGALLDVHLMVENPGMFLEPFAKAGADHCTFHIEVAPHDRAGARRAMGELVERCRSLGMTAGVAINPPTDMSRLLDALDPSDPALTPDMILIMSVNPGFSGQAFIAETLEKTRAARRAFGPGVRVQMDGGVKPENAAAVREAGCDVLVAASAVFGKPQAERAGVIRALRES